MFNSITWVAFSISTFFNFYDNKDDYFEKETSNYQARVEREYKKAHKSELLKKDDKGMIVAYI